MTRAWAGLLAALVASGCNAPAAPPLPERSGSAAPPPMAECQPPVPGSVGFPELRGTVSGDGQVWGLVFDDYPARQDRQTKIVFRMTGSGDVKLSASGPGGAQASPEWGPEPHLGSNWRRPGDEWGTGWRFPEPGCWTVRLTRGTTQGTVGVRVRA